MVCPYDIYSICGKCVVVCQNSSIEVLNTNTSLISNILLSADDGQIVNSFSTTSSSKFGLVTDKMILKIFEVHPEIKLVFTKMFDNDAFPDQPTNVNFNSNETFISFSGIRFLIIDRIFRSKVSSSIQYRR